MYEIFDMCMHMCENIQEWWDMLLCLRTCHSVELRIRGLTWEPVFPFYFVWVRAWLLLLSSRYTLLSVSEFLGSLLSHLPSFLIIAWVLQTCASTTGWGMFEIQWNKYKGCSWQKLMTNQPVHEKAETSHHLWISSFKLYNQNGKRTLERGVGIYFSS